jgi:GNAT superfamily N-acetyltransferase
MIDSAPSYPNVVRGTPADAEFIVQWLKVEWDEGGERFGFWGNREMIREAAGSAGDLWVIRENGQAVAFQVGDYSADILAVRPDRRKAGLGTVLSDAALERAMRDNVTVLQGQCSPETSLTFWQRIGFEQYHDRRRPNDVFVRKVLHRKFDLPEGANRTQVVIAFYPEEAQYYGREDKVSPVAVHEVQGALLDDGTVQLERRVIGLEDDEPEGMNLAIRIEVDGEKVYFGKAKYEEAERAGVVNDRRNGVYYLDEVYLTKNRSDEGGQV